MKKLFYLAICIPVLALGQSTDQNYVKSTTYKQPTTTPLATPDVSAANVQVSYFDGLGRPVQQIAHKQSHSGKDIVTHMEYDAFGRQTKEFLPFANDAASLNYQDATATLMALNGFYSDYNGGTSNPYSEKQLENSPLSRVFKQAAPGNSWALGSGKEIKFDYQTNAQGEVRYFKVVASWNATKGLYLPSIVQTGHYEQNQLFKTITTDENGNKTEEFKDKEGRVILKRSFNLTPPSGAGGLYDTYYLYDQFGNLTYVIPPLAEGIANEQNLNGLGYQYRYDSRNRLVEKKLPGKQWEFIIYDKLDRPIATGPAFDPYGEGQIGWMVTQYDALGRVTQTGWKQMNVSETQRKSNQANVMSGGNPFVLSQPEILTKNFYDTYHTATGAPTTSQTVEGQATVVHVKGMPTGSWVKVLDPTQPQAAETSYTLYDSKFRPVRTRTNNHLGGYTQVDTKLDWAGKTLYTLTKHKREQSSTELLVKDSFTYTAQDRLAVHKQQINQLPKQLLASNTYDELGQLISKNVGGTDVTGTQGLQKVDYTYNIRGWLKGINDTNDIQSENDLFAFKISYNDPEYAVEALHNGNISETHWKTASDNILRLYHYQYDDLNRMISGNYIREGGNYHNSFLETLEYDKNGNITRLNRNGDNDAVDYVYPIDELKYYYHPQKPNQLMKVEDGTNSPQGFKDGANTGDDYAYDANGNMISDQNKNIEAISYNHLNLPTKIFFGDGNQIIYLYNATGQKLSKVVQAAEEIRTDYLTGFQYHKRELNFFPHAEGYVSVVEGRFKYVFNYTDHLGNIRLSYSDANGDNNIQQEEILEESNYYPFGLKHTAYNTNQKKYIRDEELNELILSFFPRFAGDGRYNYKYNGKELQDELGLNMYDYGARNYDPALGRWMNIDEKAEFYVSSSLYIYVLNNPVSAIDPDGKLVIFVNGYFSRAGNATKHIQIPFYGSMGALAPGNSGEKYWNYFSSQAIGSVREFLGVNNTEANYFVDGSSYVGFDQSGADRYQNGYKYAEKNYTLIVSQLAEGETLKFVGHSEGSAFAAGMMAYFLDRGMNDSTTPKVESSLHLSPDEADEFSLPDYGGTDYQIHNNNDPISPFYELKGAEFIFVGSKSSKGGAHGGTVSRRAINNLKAAIEAFINSSDTKKIETENGTIYYKAPAEQ